MQDDFAEALGKALKHLQSSDRFESEVRRCLSSYAPETTDAVVAHLREKKILDEQRAADQRIRRFSGKRALGRTALMERLADAPEDVRANAMPEREAERERLWSLLTSKYSPTDNPMKAGRFLFSRGFLAEDIEPALERYFSEAPE